MVVQRGNQEGSTCPGFSQMHLEPRFNYIASKLAFIKIGDDPIHNSDVTHSATLMVNGKSKVQHNWTAVNPLLKGFNDQRENLVTPGDQVHALPSTNAGIDEREKTICGWHATCQQNHS